MILNFKQADEGELDEINKLIFDSEMVSTGGKSNMDIFAERYTIRKPDLLENKSYVLNEGKCIVGFFMIMDRGTGHELEDFYIRHDRLGQGYGKRLWNSVEDICTQNNIRSVDIVCGKNVTAFYLKMGAE